MRHCASLLGFLFYAYFSAACPPVEHCPLKFIFDLPWLGSAPGRGRLLSRMTAISSRLRIRRMVSDYFAEVINSKDSVLLVISFDYSDYFQIII